MKTDWNKEAGGSGKGTLPAPSIKHLAVNPELLRLKSLLGPWAEMFWLTVKHLSMHVIGVPLSSKVLIVICSVSCVKPLKCPKLHSVSLPCLWNSFWQVSRRGHVCSWTSFLRDAWRLLLWIQRREQRGPVAPKSLLHNKMNHKIFLRSVFTVTSHANRDFRFSSDGQKIFTK